METLQYLTHEYNNILILYENPKRETNKRSKLWKTQLDKSG